MTSTELIAKIKAEIERLQKYNHCMADNAINSNMRNFYDGEEDCCKQLLFFLSTLESEKPINPEAAMKELDEKIALVKQRGTWDGVDVDKYMDEVRGREPEKPMEQEKEVESCHKTRKKLAEWSKTPEGRKAYEKVAEEMRKQIVPNDLEEAANEFANQDCVTFISRKKAFIAGAKWQAEQDEKEQADLFTIVALDAAQRAKEQMMRGAVEGEITKDNRGNNVIRAGVFNKDFEYGQKVRVIVLPKED